MPLSQTFGVEFECYLPDGATMQSAARAVSARLGAPVLVEPYNHQRRVHWKVVTDGSLNDNARGCEFVSPVLTGEAGLAQVEAVARALTDFGCTVSRKCGMHVHVGVAGEQIAFFRNLVKLYAAYEPVIDAIMPPSRRASTCGYARSMTQWRPAVIDAQPTLADLMLAIGQGRLLSDRRYWKVNLCSFERHTTVEFRQHSGTTDPVKARMWTLLCLRLVAAAKRPAAAVVASGRSANRARIGSKAWRVGQMMLRPEGVTGGEVMAALNWPSVSLPAQARACGISFTTQRMGRLVRYFARAAGAESTVPTAITIDGFAQVIGAADVEVAYMRQRTADLGGAVAWAA